MASSKNQAIAPLVYVDACVYLDLIMRNESLDAYSNPRWKSALSVFDAAKNKQIRLAASPLLEAEVLCNGASRVDKTRVQGLLRGWFHADSTAWMEIDRFLVRDAVKIVDEFSSLRFNKAKKMGSADALHLAAAVRLKCDYFFSHDGGFPLDQSVNDVRVRTPQVVWQPTLFDSAII